MNIRNTFTTCVNYVKNNKANIASKIGGAVVAGYVLTNMDYSGKQDSVINVKRKQADRIAKSYVKSRMLEDRNFLISKLKDAVFRNDLEWNLPDKITAFTGYIGGAFNQLAVDIVPAVLATGALLSKNYAKYFGAGLAIWGAKTIVCDVLDAGRVDSLKTTEL